MGSDIWAGKQPKGGKEALETEWESLNAAGKDQQVKENMLREERKCKEKLPLLNNPKRREGLGLHMATACELLPTI